MCPERQRRLGNYEVSRENGGTLQELSEHYAEARCGRGYSGRSQDREAARRGSAARSRRTGERAAGRGCRARMWLIDWRKETGISRNARIASERTVKDGMMERWRWEWRCWLASASSAPAITPFHRSIVPSFSRLSHHRRLHYDGGGDWYANPSSLPTLTALRERTTLPVAERERGDADGPSCGRPYLYMTGHGTCISRTWRSATCDAISSRAGSSMPTTIMEWTRHSGAKSRACFRTIPFEVPLTHPIYNLVYAFPRGIPRSTSTRSPRAGLRHFLGNRLVVYYPISRISEDEIRRCIDS